MKKLILSQSLQSKLWIALLASCIGLSACSGETEEMPNASTSETESSEVTPVQTASGPEAEASVNNSTEDSGGTAYYSGSGNAEGEEKADDTVTVNENNPNIQERVPEGVQ